MLRMARPLDVQAERAADPVLDELLTWATTVVRLPLLPKADRRLSLDMHGGRAGARRAPRRSSPWVSSCSPRTSRRSSWRTVGHTPSGPPDADHAADRRPAHRAEERTGKANTIRWRVFTTTHTARPSGPGGRR